MKPTDLTAPGKELVRIFAVAAIYLVTAKAGLLLAIPHTNATPIWPATGVALGAVLLLGYRIWPAIAIGAFLANLWHLSSIGFLPPSALVGAFSTAIGDTLEALVGGLLIRRFVGERNPFVRLDDMSGLYCSERSSPQSSTPPLARAPFALSAEPGSISG